MADQAGDANPEDMVVQVNRSPVMTLWAAIVAVRSEEQEEPCSWDTALTIGKSVADSFAFSKGRMVGVYTSEAKTPETKRDEAENKETDTHFWCMGKKVLVRSVSPSSPPSAPVALANGVPLDPQNVEKYVKTAFGEAYERVRTELTSLAERYLAMGKLVGDAYALYERFRPMVPPGKRGFGAKGLFDLSLLSRLGTDLDLRGWASSSGPGEPVGARKPHEQCIECGRKSFNIKFLETFGLLVCNACKIERYPMMTKTKAKEQYLCTDGELMDLKTMTVKNPKKPTFAPMKLYLASEIKEIVRGKWPTEQALAEARQARELKRLEKRIARKRKNTEKDDPKNILKRQEAKRKAKANYKEAVVEAAPHVHEFESDDGEQKCTTCGMVVDEEEF